ncbi:MAG TPA: enoyl-CoA hydratase/isomerase family protein [Brevibacterium sp.]|nr:enoyl-CoA hydratase/isomerase family protein [Brevibacterium sp.]
MTMTAQGDEASVLTRVDGGLGRIELNKPKAINALSADMVSIIADTLTAWKDDDAVRAVLVTGAGDRGLCAGGDIKAIHRGIVEGTSEAVDFWADEYRMNLEIAQYPKPYIAIMDGITMGGGVGLSVHGSHRIVTETTKLGMPETGIGLFPDVGGTHLLARVPQQGVGMHLALTGQPIGAGDAIRSGLADTFVPRERIADLAIALSQSDEDVDAVIARFAADPPPSELEADEAWIASSYDAATAAEVVAALRTHADERARAAGDLIATKSPLSVAVTFEMIRTAGDMTLEEVLERDFRAGSGISAQPDLREGIRAQVIDKDRDPQWSPASLDEVDPALVTSILSTEQTRKVFS